MEIVGMHRCQSKNVRTCAYEGVCLQCVAARRKFNPFAFIYIHLRAHNTHIIAFDVKYVPHTIRKYLPNVWSSNHHKGGINSTSVESLTATKYRKLSLSHEISLEFISVIIQLEYNTKFNMKSEIYFKARLNHPFLSLS